MIFYEQDLEDPWSHNEELLEVTDPKLVATIKSDLNISFRYEKEIAPVITGSVVTGGFKRKLRMIRADLFSLLSISQSIHTVASLLQVKALKRGILTNLTKNQDIRSKDSKQIAQLMGW